jgi:ABC-type phosphate/phosphonate transport system permease subunit
MVVRGLLVAERSLPSFVVLLVLLIAIGTGPFAGMLFAFADRLYRTAIVGNTLAMDAAAKAA